MYTHSLGPAELSLNPVILDSAENLADIATAKFFQSLQYGFVSVFCVVSYEWFAKYVLYDVFSTSLHTIEHVHSLPDEIRLVRSTMLSRDGLNSSLVSRVGNRCTPMAGRP